MAVGINPSLSLTAQRNLQSSQSSLAVAMQRLSSGLRINSARDDAAGLAISERFTSQIRGQNQAVRNANDGISMLQTADGATSTIAANLQRIRELAVQSANATNSVSDRQALQQEVNQLAAEIDRVGVATQFNGLKVFDQNRSKVTGYADVAKDAVMEGLQYGWLENSENNISSLFGIQADGAAMNIQLSGFTDGAGGVAAYVQATGFDAQGKGTGLTLQVDLADFTPPNLPDGGTSPFYADRIIQHEMVHAVMARATNWQDVTSNNLWFAEGTAEFIHGADERVAGDVAASSAGAVVAAINGPTNTSAFYSASYSAVRYMHSRIKSAGGTGIKDVLQYMSANPSATLDQALANASHGQFTSASDFKTQFAAAGAAFIGTFNLTNTDTGAIGGLDVDSGDIKTKTSVVNDFGNRSGTDVLSGFTENWEDVSKAGGTGNILGFQVGANAGQKIDTAVGAMNIDALGLRGVDITSIDSSNLTMRHVDMALNYLSDTRAKLGAQMSRFDTAIQSLQTSSENMSASRSRVMDADFAIETAELSRAKILQQAGTAMVAQANLMPRSVLTLLR